MSPSDPELLAWEQAAPDWTRNAERIAAMTRPATDALLARLAVSPGQRVLDVAAGAGDPSLRLAELVGPGGHVTAADGVGNMLAELRRRAASSGLAQLDVLLAAAEDLDLPRGSFDAACCRFGAMFFRDPRRALARMADAVRTDGRLALVVWGHKERNPYFTLAMGALDEVGAAAASVSPGERTVFEYAEPGALVAVASRAGWLALAEHREAIRMPLPVGRPEELLDLYLGMSRKVGERAASLDREGRERLRAAIARRAAPFAGADGLVLPAEIVTVTGRAP